MTTCTPPEKAAFTKTAMRTGLKHGQEEQTSCTSPASDECDVYDLFVISRPSVRHGHLSIFCCARCFGEHS
jgi:hypothetical protein